MLYRVRILTPYTWTHVCVQCEWLVQQHRAGPFGLGVTDSALKVRQRRRGDDGSMLETTLRFNFPMNTELRDTFVAGLNEVLTPSYICMYMVYIYAYAHMHICVYTHM